METHQCCSNDILIKILTFLSPKSLMRFKCVSKAWNTLIRHPDFVSHYARSQARPSATQLLFQLKAYPNKKHDRLVHPETSEVFPLELNCFCYDGGQRSICSNHCNGLVCLYSYRYTEVYLYSVTTRELKPFPPFLNREIIRSKQYALDPKLFLGFDGNYKLLHVFDCRGEKEGKILTLGVANSSGSKIRVFNDESNNNHNSCNFSMECIFLNGVLYWAPKICVVYFNFREEKFGYILPPNPQRCYFKEPSRMLTALSGKLVMCCRDSYYSSSLLLYDDVKEIFTKVYASCKDANEIFTDVSLIRKHVIEIAATLLGAERINDKTKEVAHVLATTSVISSPASLLSSPRPCCLRFDSSFGEHNNVSTTTRPLISCRTLSH